MRRISRGNQILIGRSSHTIWPAGGQNEIAKLVGVGAVDHPSILSQDGAQLRAQRLAGCLSPPGSVNESIELNKSDPRPRRCTPSDARIAEQEAARQGADAQRQQERAELHEQDLARGEQTVQIMVARATGVAARERLPDGLQELAPAAADRPIRQPLRRPLSSPSSILPPHELLAEAERSLKLVRAYFEQTEDEASLFEAGATRSRLAGLLAPIAAALEAIAEWEPRDLERYEALEASDMQRVPEEYAGAGITGREAFEYSRDATSDLYLMADALRRAQILLANPRSIDLQRLEVPER